MVLNQPLETVVNGTVPHPSPRPTGGPLVCRWLLPLDPHARGSGGQSETYTDPAPPREAAGRLLALAYAPAAATATGDPAARARELLAGESAMAEAERCLAAEDSTTVQAWLQDPDELAHWLADRDGRSNLGLTFKPAGKNWLDRLFGHKGVRTAVGTAAEVTRAQFKRLGQPAADARKAVSMAIVLAGRLKTLQRHRAGLPDGVYRDGVAGLKVALREANKRAGMAVLADKLAATVRTAAARLDDLLKAAAVEARVLAEQRQEVLAAVAAAGTNADGGGRFVPLPGLSADELVRRAAAARGLDTDAELAAALAEELDAVADLAGATDSLAAARAMAGRAVAALSAVAGGGSVYAHLASDRAARTLANTLYPLAAPHGYTQLNQPELGVVGNPVEWVELPAATGLVAGRLRDALVAEFHKLSNGRLRVVEVDPSAPVRVTRLEGGLPAAADASFLALVESLRSAERGGHVPFTLTSFFGPEPQADRLFPES